MSQNMPQIVDIPCLHDLQIPSEFAKFDETADSNVIVQLEEWKRKAYTILARLRDFLRSRPSPDTRFQAEVVYLTAAFDSSDPWALESSREVAKDILSMYTTPSADILEKVLREFVKPVFRPNPHPSINVETGRKLPHAAGGRHGYLDYLEGQEWKTHPAISNVLSWCILHADTRSVEKLWHLFIPPVMTLLDDYEAIQKLRGIRLASQLLDIASPDMLRRTGVDTLLLTSFKTSLTFHHNSESPELVRAAVTATVRLIELTTSAGSAARFDQLCSLLGDSIIGNIWVYASRELEEIQASVEVIPGILQVLGIGASRYLKALIPQLLFPIIPAPDNGASLAYKRASLQALQAVIEACASRIYKWRGSILDAVLRCWVDLLDNGDAIGDDQCIELKNDLRSAYQLLQTVCGPVGDLLNEGNQPIIALDVALFRPLLRPVEVAVFSE